MARGRGKNDDGKDGGRHDAGRDGDTGRRGKDDQQSNKIDPKNYGSSPWNDKDGKDSK